MSFSKYELDQWDRTGPIQSQRTRARTREVTCILVLPLALRFPLSSFFFRVKFAPSRARARSTKEKKKKRPFDYHDCHQNEKGGLLFQFIYTISSRTASEHTVIRLYIPRYNRVPSFCRSRALIYTNLCANSSFPFKIIKRVVQTDRGAFKLTSHGRSDRSLPSADK